MTETPVSGWAGYATGFGAAIAVTIVTTAVPDRPLWTLGALTAMTGALAASTALRAALAAAAVCWALYTGFVLDHFGELRFSAGSAGAAALLAAAALAGYAGGTAVRAIRHTRRLAAHGAAAIPRQRAAERLGSSSESSPA